MNEIRKDDMKGGVFLRLSVAKETQDVISVYENAVTKVIRKGKDKYNMKEYAACLERSLEGFIHVHIYVHQFLPLKEINKQGCSLIGVEDASKNNLSMVKVENEEHFKNIIDYIGKAPLRTGVCKIYKEKYGGKTRNPVKDKKPVMSKNGAANEIIGGKRMHIASDLKKLNFYSAEHKRDVAILFKSQRDLEQNLIILQSIEFLRKKGGKNYKNKINVLNDLKRYLEPYIIYEQISKMMSLKRKEIMLLNMVYIALQLENIQGNNYIYYKLGEILFKYYDLNKTHIKNLIEKYKDKIKDIKKITKKEGKMIYKEFFNSVDFKSYKESIIKIGVKFFLIFKEVFFNVREIKNKDRIDKRLVLKPEISLKISNVLNNEKVKSYKFKIPFINKPKEGGPDLNDGGGWHSEELRSGLVKENINAGHDLDFNHKVIYPIINKMQSIEYTVNKKFLDFVLLNKEDIYNYFLTNFEKDSVSYKTRKEQFNIILNIASYMLNYEKFYFTYDFDYRGRVYPKQEYLNYQGDLLARALIVGKNKKKKDMLGLKIACASLYNGLIGKNYEMMLVFFDEKIDKGNLSDGKIYIKDAKEPILGLALFFELKMNKSDVTDYIIGFDATCSGSQLISLLTDDDTYLKYLNMTSEDVEQVYDYYTYIYNQYGKFKNVEDKHARKIVKKTIMTVNYGLTLIGCHRKIYPLLKEYNYCKDGNDYKKNGKNQEITKFYNYIQSLSLVKNLEPLQMIGNELCKNKLTYQFVIGEHGLFIDSFATNENYIFKVKTISYKKYYKNLSIYNKSRKMKEKGYKYLGYYKSIDVRKQKRQIKANLIHMLDATGNILVCKHFTHDIATIHDCHGVHSSDVNLYFDVVRQVLICLFIMNNQYYNLLKNMLLYYKECTNNHEFYKNMMYNYVIHFYRIVFINKGKGGSIKRATYLFIPK